VTAGGVELPKGGGKEKKERTKKVGNKKDRINVVGERGAAIREKIEYLRRTSEDRTDIPPGGTKGRLRQNRYFSIGDEGHLGHEKKQAVQEKGMGGGVGSFVGYDDGQNGGVPFPGGKTFWDRFYEVGA